jgi:hypothetical protein
MKALSPAITCAANILAVLTSTDQRLRANPSDFYSGSPAPSKMAGFTSSLLPPQLARHEFNPFAVFALHR